MTIRQITAILSCALFTLTIGCSPIPDEDRGMEGNEVEAVEVDVVEPAASTGTVTPKRDATAAGKPQIDKADDGLDVVVEKEVK